MTGLVLRGAEVFDPASGVTSVRDIRVADGRLSDGPAQPADAIVDVAGMLVAPGFVDLHTHVFVGQDLAVDADRIAGPAGTTTFVDTGSAGGHLFGAFRRSVLDTARVRVRAFLNIASIGTTSILLGGELRSPWYADEEVAIEAVEANRDVVVGVKVRASADVGGAHATEALHRARRVADHVGLPLMVHLGPAPAGVDEIVDLLRAGDILTHAFSGWEGNRIVDGGTLRTSVRAARERGVLLDVGHGMSGFDAETARIAVQAGEYPDTISTDLHAYSRESVVDMPTVASKFLALGMSLPDVLSRVTAAPAQAIGLDAGTLGAGAPADLVVLRRERGEFDLGGIAARERLAVALTIAGGRVIFDPEGRA